MGPLSIRGGPYLTHNSATKSAKVKRKLNFKKENRINKEKHFMLRVDVIIRIDFKKYKKNIQDVLLDTYRCLTVTSF